MDLSFWNVTEETLPDEGVVVDTVSAGGAQQHLKRSGGLWFLPDGSMYVYYTPRFWRAL